MQAAESPLAVAVAAGAAALPSLLKLTTVMEKNSQVGTRGVVGVADTVWCTVLSVPSTCGRLTGGGTCVICMRTVWDGMV